MEATAVIASPRMPRTGSATSRLRGSSASDPIELSPLSALRRTPASELFTSSVSCRIDGASWAGADQHIAGTDISTANAQAITWHGLQSAGPIEVVAMSGRVILVTLI